MSKLSKLRDRALIRQHGKCCYCNVLLLPPGTGPLSATAEHLVPRSEDGATDFVNIAAACRYCNSTRARAKRPLSPDAFRKRALARLNQGRWHQSHTPSGSQMGAESVLLGQRHR
jgi:5-methylcytosine-specific restriction endonuclease McrA